MEGSICHLSTLPSQHFLQEVYRKFWNCIYACTIYAATKVYKREWN